MTQISNIIYDNRIGCDPKGSKFKLQNFICRPIKYMNIPDLKEKYDYDTPKDHFRDAMQNIENQ